MGSRWSVRSMNGFIHPPGQSFQGEKQMVYEVRMLLRRLAAGGRFRAIGPAVRILSYRDTCFLVFIISSSSPSPWSSAAPPPSSYSSFVNSLLVRTIVGTACVLFDARQAGWQSRSGHSASSLLCHRTRCTYHTYLFTHCFVAAVSRLSCLMLSAGELTKQARTAILRLGKRPRSTSEMSEAVAYLRTMQMHEQVYTTIRTRIFWCGRMETALPHADTPAHESFFTRWKYHDLLWAIYRWII